MKNELHIADLISKKLKGTISSDEQKELDGWIAKDPANKAVYNEAVDPQKHLEKLDQYQRFDKKKARKKLEDELFETKTISFQSRRIMRFAAAILLPVLIAGTYFTFFMDSGNEDMIAEIDASLQPGSETATLVLSSGESIALTPTASFKTMSDGAANISREESRVIYSMKDIPPGSTESTVYNELKTPRGGSFGIQLSDGTSVWLNAGSTLKFPVNFSDSIRNVTLEGEGYFEVTHNSKPFIVSTEASDVRVLGTKFNVTAYASDQEVITTLVEGKVAVTAPETSNEIILSPNEQAITDKASMQINKMEVDASGYVSWVNGKVEFHNESLDEVLKKLSRWYDFEYTFEDEAARDFHFSARMSRDEKVSSILDMLEMTTDVEFAYENGIIVVK